MPRLKQEIEEKIKESIFGSKSLIEEYRSAVENNELWLTEDAVTEAIKEISDLKDEIDLLQDELVKVEPASVCSCGELIQGDCEECQKRDHEEFKGEV